jgi:hypothetical protein
MRSGTTSGRTGRVRSRASSPGVPGGLGALASSARLIVFETVLADEAEHRRRVATRRPDLGGQIVPTWDQVVAGDHVTWDEVRDGPRRVIDMTDSKQGAMAALAYLGHGHKRKTSSR